MNQIPTPIDMLLFCPKCGEQHVDAPDERTPDWTNPPHKKHLCHFCQYVWRPCDSPTNGVAALGSNDISAVSQLKSTQAELAEARSQLSQAACEISERVEFIGEQDGARRRLESELAALKAQLLRCKPFVEAPLSVIPLGEREAILREVFGGSE